jgi:hypothetical protein
MYKDNNECAIAGVASVNGPKSENLRAETSKMRFTKLFKFNGLLI